MNEQKRVKRRNKADKGPVFGTEFEKTVQNDRPLYTGFFESTFELNHLQKTKIHSNPLIRIDEQNPGTPQTVF